MFEIDSLEKLTDFFNRPLDKKWIDICQSDLDFYYKIQFESSLNTIRVVNNLLTSFESMIERNYEYKNENYNFIRFEIFLGFYTIKQCRRSLEFLDHKKYLKSEKTESFQNEITEIENILLEYAKKFGKVKNYE